MSRHAMLQAAPVQAGTNPLVEAKPDAGGRSRTPLLAIALGTAVLTMIPLRATEVLHSDMGRAVQAWISERTGWLAASTPTRSERPVTATAMLSAGPVPPAAPAPAAARMSPVGNEAIRPADGRLVAEVTRRSLELDRRAQTLDGREARLTAGEALVREQMAELSRLRRDVEQLVVRESEAAEAEIGQVVQMFASMRPQQAAKVLEKMVAAKAAIVMFRLEQRQAGPILAQMEQASALAVTQEMMGRREAFRR